MAFENYSIRQFMDAWFKDDRTVMSEEEFITAKAEYIDIAELYDEEDLAMAVYILYLRNRINSIKTSVILQRTFLEEFGEPYRDNLSVLRKYGYVLTWRKDAADFDKQLTSVEKKESKYEHILTSKKQELEEFRERKQKEKATDNKTDDNYRHTFIRTLNSLGKVGYIVDKDSTTVEEFAFMIRQQNEEYREYKLKSK